MNGPLASQSGAETSILRVRLSRAKPEPGGWRSGAGALAMRQAARSLLDELALDSGAPVGTWPKLKSGAPRPVRASAEHAPGGTLMHWAVSHSRGLVAAALFAGGPFGLDLEASDREPSQHIADRLARLGFPAPALASPPDRRAAWTQTEAVLKANGVGLGELSQVRFRPAPQAIPDRAAQGTGLAPSTPENRRRSTIAHLEFDDRPFVARTLHLEAAEAGASPAACCLTLALPGSSPPHIELSSR